MGKQSRRLRTPAPTGMDSAAAKRRVQNQLTYSETELLEIFNSRAVTQFMTGTDEVQRKLVCPVLQERLHSCMPQVACPADRLEDLAVRVGVILNRMDLPKMVSLLRGSTDAFVGELQFMFDDLRLSDEHRDADLSERRILTKWLGRAHVLDFLQSGYEQRRATIRNHVRHPVAQALSLEYYEPCDEHSRLVTDYVADKILELDMPDILAMFDADTHPKLTERFTKYACALAPAAHRHAQRTRTGKKDSSMLAKEAVELCREQAMERIRAFRAHARERGAAFAERALRLSLIHI